ncbi:acyltransferase [Sulfurimonas autotrophica]|uniref:Transferase hexapeptide repeat containing protein n=1 Tax=Sulfurimonas autotrophica (strain ATCC BAA-671 / DSM 16294 / JCM 11897 / OK10) TaxID=563040 RepID=E0UV23_SULAO|nr:acyltransferase [Sulfurimonas autotrophica]ADN09605.1 transferase hexapeptide repeat containing protein [Sulfurimonas autotrophica DSM 16294]
MKKFTLMQKFRNKIRVKGNVDLNISSSAKIANCDISINGKNNKLVIHDGVTIRYTQIEILGDNCSIYIGKNCIVGHGCYLSAKESKRLLIKDECMLSRNVKIMTSDGHYIYQNNDIINHGLDITIEHNVWLADNVTILKGVNVGENSVIAINSTVTKNVPAAVIVAGNPAKVVKEDIAWR